MKLNTKRLTIALAVTSALVSMMSMTAMAQDTAPAAPAAPEAATPAAPVVAANDQAVVQTPAAEPEAQESTGKISAAAAAAAASKQTGIQTVVVTAQKRKEDASKVPLSISVLGGDELQAQHIGDFADITRAVPNVSFSGGGGGGDAGDGPGLSNIEIRGVSSSAGSATVGIYMDDVSMTVANLYSMGSAEPKFFDIDHVEVLRGPQGTLYGSSSMGGTIKFVTNQPNLKENTTDVYSEAYATKGGQGSYNGSVVFNEVAIPNELAFRFGVEGGHKGGYINNVDYSGNVTEYGINWQDDQVVKFAAKWEPTKELTITPAVFYQKVKTGDTDVSMSQVIQNGNTVGIPYVPLAPYENSKITHEPGADELLVPSVTIGYSTDYGDLTAVTSYFKRTFNRTQDGGATNSYQLGNVYINNTTFPNLATVVEGLPSSVTLDNEVTQFAQEIRFASKPYEKGGSPFTWIVGAYGANEHTSIVENDYVYGVNAAFAAAGASTTNFDPANPNNSPGGSSNLPNNPAFNSGTWSPGFPGDNTFAGIYRYHDTQQSIFGETSYYFTPELHATLGLRYLRAQEEFYGNQGLFYQGQNNDINIVDQSGTKTTPKIAVVWEISPTNSVFATAAEGFRVGGTNSQVPYTLCGLPGPNQAVFNSDSLWSYEVGTKSKFFNNKLTVDGSLFYLKWKDMQQEVELGCSYDFNTNVGNATSYGAEVEIKAKPIPSFLIDLAAGYTHATLDASLPPPAVAPGTPVYNVQNGALYGAVGGYDIPGVPNYNIALTGTYSYDFNDDYFGFLRAAARWVGTSTGGFPLLPNGETNLDADRPAYHLIDASTGVSWGQWEATLFVKNLFNNNMVIQRPVVQANTVGEVYRIEPRTIGVSLSAKF